VLDGDPAPPPPKGLSPQFSAHICCGQMATWIKMPLCMEVGLGPGHIELGLHLTQCCQLPSPKRGQSPQFSAIFYCGQTGGCIKMPLGMEAGDFVLDRDPAPAPHKGAEPPIFGPRVLWPNCCMDQDATWYGGKPRPRRRCARWGRSSPSFRFMSIMAKRLDG